MTRSGTIAVVAALLLAGTSFATAKVRGVAGAHGKPFHPTINETTSRPTAADPYYRLSDRYYRNTADRYYGHTAADPYYRLSDRYYGHTDPLHGLFNYYAVPPYSPGYSYRFTGWR
jgi:hypothetical protein